MIWVEHITAIAKVEIRTALLTSSAYRPIKWAIAVDGQGAEAAPIAADRNEKQVKLVNLLLTVWVK